MMILKNSNKKIGKWLKVMKRFLLNNGEKIGEMKS
jgi:hypothetical protein